MVIDDGLDCRFPVYQVTDNDFSAIFSEKFEIEFIEDILKRDDISALDEIFERMWTQEIPKAKAQGIHGTLFYDEYDRKKYFPEKIWNGTPSDLRGK
ncbi:hypothetical protein C3941_07535 [Kaistia algarum]|uniref:hypothetical protein n=1 Tax=Kaistia algarum TaxID=2083279 RepID=UPI000CE7EFF7|nr:hypothetical protein [Kaistia algarum]MCX5511909.1 hypothetical protein [Kaistia algarum]PPE80042.1 hypothetical protein C3941_07535 [Kaistia algarum]